MAYVRQEQDFYPFLTVKETLLIAAGLRLDRSVPAQDVQATFCRLLCLQHACLRLAGFCNVVQAFVSLKNVGLIVNCSPSGATPARTHRANTNGQSFLWWRRRAKLQRNRAIAAFSRVQRSTTSDRASSSQRLYAAPTIRKSCWTMALLAK